MKYLSVLRLQPGKFTPEQAFEVFALDPYTATASDISRAKRRMGMKYHPDKRPKEEKDDADKDMSEITLAEQIARRYLELHKGAVAVVVDMETSPNLNGKRVT